MAKALYVLLKKNNLNSILWYKLDDIDFQALKESLMYTTSLGRPNYQTLFYLFVYEKERNAPVVLTETQRDHHQPIG